MVHLILTGATGLVGSAVLAHIRALPSTSNPITKLSILTRSPIPQLSRSTSDDGSITEPNGLKINVINHTDYLSYPSPLLAQLSDARAVIWAQGVSQTAVSSDEEYVKITKEFPLALATSLISARQPSKATQQPLNFVYVSGEGATHSPGRFTQIFARVKGEAELALLSLSKEPQNTAKLAVFCPRPGGIHSTDPQIWSESLARRNFAMRSVMKGLLPVYKVLNPGMLVTAEDLAGVLVRMALREDGKDYADEKGLDKAGWMSCEGRVLQNLAIKELAKQGT